MDCAWRRGRAARRRAQRALPRMCDLPPAHATRHPPARAPTCRPGARTCSPVMPWNLLAMAAGTGSGGGAAAQASAGAAAPAASGPSRCSPGPGMAGLWRACCTCITGCAGNGAEGAAGKAEIHGSPSFTGFM
jgi:hypothetical protein